MTEQEQITRELYDTLQYSWNQLYATHMQPIITETATADPTYTIMDYQRHAQAAMNRLGRTNPDAVYALRMVAKTIARARTLYTDRPLESHWNIFIN